MYSRTGWRISRKGVCLYATEQSSFVGRARLWSNVRASCRPSPLTMHVQIVLKHSVVTILAPLVPWRATQERGLLVHLRSRASLTAWVGSQEEHPLAVQRMQASTRRAQRCVHGNGRTGAFTLRAVGIKGGLARRLHLLES